MQTPLARWHQAHGAVLIPHRGVQLPECFTDPVQEYQAVRAKAGLIDLSFRVQIRVTGEDRTTFLQGMLSNDIKKLTAGTGCAATFLTEQGRIVADLRVYALENCFLLDVDADIREKTVEGLSRFLVADDVELEDLSTEQTRLSLQGPLAADVLTAAGMQPTLTTPFQHIEASLAGTTVRILRADDTGADGYNILTPRDATESVWQKLLQSGDRLGLQPVGFAALNMLRVEAGIPWYGIDMDEERIALEVGLDHALSFTKGCYVGQEVVERASSRGRVNRKLSGLLLEGDTAPHAGDKLFHDSQEVGWITSAVLSPRLGRPVALGYVRREHLEPGTRLRVDRSGIAVIAEVASLPFGP